MIRIFTISFDELSVDPDGCAEALNSACRRPETMKVSGVAVDEDCLLVSLESSEMHDFVYNFAPVDADNLEKLQAELVARYYASFSLISGFLLRDSRWALFAQENKQKK